MTWLNLSRRDLIQRRASRLSTAAHPANRAKQRQPLDQDPTVQKRRAQPCLRPTTEGFDRELAGRVAGEGGYGGAGKELKWDPKAIAHPQAPAARSEVARRGGAMARGGGATTVKTATALPPRPQRLSACTSTREALGTPRDDPELRSSPELGRRR